MAAKSYPHDVSVDRTEPLLDAREIDFYLFNREARLEEARTSECEGTDSPAYCALSFEESKLALEDKVADEESVAEVAIPLVSSTLSQNPLNRVVRSVRAFKRRRCPRLQTIVSGLPQRRPKLGLALGGGFARAVAHIGVLKVLEEEKIPVDFVAGTSAGAIIAAAYCAGLSASELQVLASRMRFRDFACWTLSRHGFCSSHRMAEFCERVLKLKNFEELKIPLAIVATDVCNGEAVVFTKGPLVGPMRASCAYPGMFPPIEVDGRSLTDGMLAYAVPTTPLREMGAQCVLGVSLRAGSSALSAPRHLLELIGQCFSIATAKMCDLWKKDADLVLEPNVDGFSIDCFDRARELIRNAEQITRAALPRLRKLLSAC
jgi:NTE family protein